MQSNKPLILILHPDDSYRAILSFVLRHHEMEVREAAATIACAAACLGIRPALVILDWSFCGDKPGDFLANLRKNPIFHEVPAVLVGQPPSRDLIKIAGKQGVAAVVIPQGFTIENFINRIRGVLGQTAEPKPDAPIDTNDLKQATAGVPQIAKITSQDVEARFRKMPPIPVFEFTVNALIQLAGSKEASAAELAQVVLRDPGATIHLLRRINSLEVRGDREPTCRIADAIRLLGVREFHALVESMPLLSDDPEDPLAHWITDDWLGGAVASSRIARFLAGRLHMGEPLEIEVAALLQNIGHPIIASLFPTVAAQVAAHPIPEGLRRVEVERRMLGMDHAAIGGMYLHSIHLPEWMVESVTQHHVAGSLRPDLSRHATQTIAILQSTDQILTALMGCPGIHDILEGLPDDFLNALEPTGSESPEIITRCAAIVREVRAELAFLRPGACLADISAEPRLPKAGYVCPKRLPMDVVKLFATRNIRQLFDVSVSQIQQSIRDGLPLLINLLGVRGDAALASILEHLPRDGKPHGAIVFGDNARPALVQSLESAGWPCARLPAPAANLRRLLDGLASRVGAQAA